MSKHEWIKVHLMCGVKTNIVTAVEVTGAHGADSPRFRPLVRRTAENFDMNEVSADKAYLSYHNLTFVGMQNATPFIPFKSTSLGTSENVFWEKMYNYFMYKREDFLAHYHKRSNVETTMSMIKRKFGDYLRSKTDTALVNEALAKVLCHNLCWLIQSMFEFDIVPTFCGDPLPAQKAS
jgi:hypothetical protein